MVERYLRQSPLANLQLAARVTGSAAAAGVKMSDGGFMGQLALRGSGDGAFRMAAVAALLAPLPLEPNRASEGVDIRVLWLGPDEWLVVAAEDKVEGLTRALIDKLAGQSFSVTDVSEARAVIGLAGAAAREVLSQGTALDLHPRVMAPGHVAQTLLARVPIIIHQRDDEPRYDIYVQRSLAEYLWNWLEDAAHDCGVAVVEG
ncbi:MAG: sarcosine oxidase subunit gamma [Alphaproteobacteria bacterium]